MDYKFQYTIIKRLVSFYNTTPSNRSSLVQDILNNKDLELLNDVFISTFNSNIDVNNTVSNIFDFIDLGIFEGVSYSSKDWVNCINLINFFNDKVLSEAEIKDVEYVTINSVVMNSRNNDLVSDYESISKSQKLLSENRSELVEKYELVHEFIFLSFTISCYKNFLLLDNVNYKEFENLLELNLFKWTSSFNAELKDLDELLELQDQCRALEGESHNNKITADNVFLADGINSKSDLIFEKNSYINQLSNLLNEIESKDKRNDKLTTKFHILLGQYKTIIENLPAMRDEDDSKLCQLLSDIPQQISADTTIAQLKDLKMLLSKVSVLLNTDVFYGQDSDGKIQELNSLLTNQTSIINSLKQLQNEIMTNENKQQLIKQAHNMEIDSYKENILREYELIKILEKEIIKSIVTMHKNILKVDMKKYTFKFEEMENAIKVMDIELNEKF